MQITETTAPATRQFTLVVNEDELKLIEFGLLQDRSARKAGDITNYDVWTLIGSFFEDNGIERLDEDGNDDDE